MEKASKKPKPFVKKRQKQNQMPMSNPLKGGKGNGKMPMKKPACK